MNDNYGQLWLNRIEFWSSIRVSTRRWLKHLDSDPPDCTVSCFSWCLHQVIVLSVWLWSVSNVHEGSDSGCQFHKRSLRSEQLLLVKNLIQNKMFYHYEEHDLKAWTIQAEGLNWISLIQITCSYKRINNQMTILNLPKIGHDHG